MSEAVYGVKDWIDVYRRDPSASTELRRELSQTLAAIGNSLIRAELSDDQLAQLISDLEPVRERLAGAAQTLQAQHGLRLLRGVASEHDVVMNFDFDAASGWSNPSAPRLDFVSHNRIAPNGTPTMVEAEVTLSAMHGGAPGNAHGGILAAMLDVVLARVHYRSGYMGVTGYLNVRYLQPCPLDQKLTLRAWPASAVGRKVRVRGGVWLGELQAVEAEALFVAKSLPSALSQGTSGDQG